MTLITGLKGTIIIKCIIQFHHLVNSKRFLRTSEKQSANIRRHHWGDETKITIVHSHYVISYNPVNLSPSQIQEIIMKQGNVKKELKDEGIIFKVVQTKI